MTQHKLQPQITKLEKQREKLDHRVAKLESNGRLHERLLKMLMAKHGVTIGELLSEEEKGND